MVASEVDNFTGTIPSSNSSTHIYCKPVKINYEKTLNSIECGASNGHGNTMSSEVKVPSSVVPIDVSGQPFSRMSSFRRSLIHVDFLIRRKKKKDKRRNTVAEGDVKDLKQALQKLTTDDSQFTLPNGICTYQQIITESKNDYNSKVYDDQQNDKKSLEQNNNAANVQSSKNTTVENQITKDEKSKNELNNEELKNESKHESENITRHLPSSKRKAKSHIPISTVSAAMNVAVEMRQCNGIKKDTLVLNGICNNGHHNSLESSDNKIQEEKRNSNYSYNEDGSQDESWASYKKRLQDKCRTLSNRKNSNDSNLMNKETDVSSSASSENIDPQDSIITVTTSTDSDTYFISSDESDEDTSDITYFPENCGSSISLGTASDGSLNSLLSETGTEMTSSTGTLTSIGHEHLLTPPPPPPPMILSATAKDSDIVEKLYLTCNGNKPRSKKYIKSESIFQKQEKHLKPSKPLKTDIFDFQRNKTENSKNIFTSLVSLKTYSKDKSKIKIKDVEKKKVHKNSHSHHPAFDMYGNHSPTKTKQIPTFIKENISPMMQNEEKNHMKSFLTNEKSRNSVQFSDNEDAKQNSDFVPQNSVPCNNGQNVFNITRTRGVQTVSSIPSKYEHQVTVTPVQRYIDDETKNMYHKRYPVAENQQNLRCDNISKSNCISAENQMHTSKTKRPPPPVTLQPQERSKLAARVVLDFDGKVIYTANSLDRKNCKPGHIINMYSPIQNKTCESYFTDRHYNNDHNCCNKLCQENNIRQNPSLVSQCYHSKTAYSQNNASMYSSNSPANCNIIENRSEEWYLKNDPYFARHTLTTTSSLSPQSYTPETMRTFVPKRTDIRPFSYAGNSDTYLPSNNLFPDPNISGLPTQETMLTRHNVNLHSKQMEKMNKNDSENSFNRTSDNFCISPSSQTSSSNILNKSPQSTMSTEDLFAVIHNCKKRMNIKTDSDISLASSSSRSSSPSYLRPSSSKGTLAETGFLSPRSHAHLETSGDRRSWADFRPVDSIWNERKSLASDRLGPTKPTSMHDFKMLLLQARTSSQISGPRKSAVEMLKLPLNQNNKNNLSPLPSNPSARNSISISAQNSPTIELNLCNGHSTVPFKRGNRIRTSLQSRYIMYPPIFEDCSEDLESCNDIISNKSVSNGAGKAETHQKENSNWEHKSNNNAIESDQEYPCDNEMNPQSE